MEQKRPVNTLQEIKSELKEQKQRTRKKKIKKILRVTFVFLTGILLATLVFLYDKSDYSKILSVDVIGNQYVMDQEVLDEIGFKPGASFYSFLSSSLENKVPEDSFVDSIKVTKHWFNQSMTIEVTEKKVIGYRITDKIELVAQDGSLKGLLTGQLSHLQDLVRFSGFNENAHLDPLVDGLSRVEPVLYSNISEIIRDPKTYDENYLKVMMADGVQLYTSIYSLESLDATTFTEIFNRMKENQKCLVYDVFWRSTYAKECESGQ